MSVRGNTVGQDSAHYSVTITTQNNVLNLFLKKSYHCTHGVKNVTYGCEFIISDITK
jgi:hypothetical protein